jgi:predicted RecB family nuclease
MQTDEIRLELLRKLASRQRLRRPAFIIRYKPSNSPFDFEYDSARRRKWTPPALQEKIPSSMKHVRWLPVGIRELEELCEKYEDPHFRRTSRAPNEFAN